MARGPGSPSRTDRPCRGPRLLRRRRRGDARPQRRRRTRSEAKRFFFAEYRLNHLLFTYPKPTIAIMDGITMGGGVGISLPVRLSRRDREHAPGDAGDEHRPVPRRRRRLVPVAPARPRRPVHGADRRPPRRRASARYLRLATHYVEQSELWRTLSTASSRRPDRAPGRARGRIVNPPDAKIEQNLPQIARLFAADRLEDILAALDAEESEWARSELATLGTKSPLSCKVSLRLLAEGAEPCELHRRDARRICARRPGRAHPRFSRGRARAADRQGQQPAVGPGDSRGGYRRDARRPVRAASAERGVDALPGTETVE